MRILLSQINPVVADLEGNCQKIIKSIEHAKKNQADIVLFPELALTGYPPEDFLLLDHFIQATEDFLQKIVEVSDGIIAIVGTPRRVPNQSEKKLYNSAAIIENGTLLGFQDKSLLPTYDLFDERRYFEPALESKVWTLCGQRIAVTICEDIWQHGDLVKETSYRHDPVQDLAQQRPDLLLNLSASPFSLKQLQNRLHAVSKAAQTLGVTVCLCNQVGGNDSLIFDGRSLICDPEGRLIAAGKAFEEDQLLWSAGESQGVLLNLNETEDLYGALVLGVRDYFAKQGFTKACLGLSGGIDSAVVACLAQEALGAENVFAVALPSRFSSQASLIDARALADNLNLRIEDISIEEPFQSFLNLLEPHFKEKPFDAAEENLQARIRGMILMALSNKHGYIVLSTGNKSEIAMGYSTLYGDMCGGLSVLSDVTKEQVYQLARWINRNEEIIPQSIIDKPPSAELRPDQKDSDFLPPYHVIDQVLTAYVEEHQSPQQISQESGLDLELVEDIVRRIHQNEYKRRQSAPGLRISEKAFTVGRKFPIVQKWL